MRREDVWGTNLEMMAFSEITSLNINIYTSSDQQQKTISN